MLVLTLVVLSLQLVPVNSTHLAPEANSPSLPNYQWQFLSDQERADVDASLKVIMNERFKNITLNIQEDAGVPYTGKLQVTQTLTDFINWAGYSPGVPFQRADDWYDFLAMNPSRSFEVHVPWDQVGFLRGEWHFSTPDWEYAEGVRHGMTDFHIFLGPAVGECCYWIPDWAKNLDYDSLKSAMREYVEAVVSHFKGRIHQYGLWWEANAWYGNDHWPVSLSLDHIIDIIKMEALTIRATDPSARICVELVRVTPNSLQYMSGSSNWTTEYFAQQLLAAGVPFDVLGLETHIGTGWRGSAGDVSTLYNWLIELEKFGKPFYIWEDGLESYLPPYWLAQQQDGPAWVGTWHGTPSEEKQAEYMVAETFVYLGNPSVIGLRWNMLCDEFPWSSNLSDDGVLYAANGARKKSFYALEQLWSGLMVNETIQSIDGVATFRGLAGNYSISVEGYEAEPSVVHVSDVKPNTFSLVLRSFALRDQASQILASVGSNITSAGGMTFQSSEAKNLFNQSFDEYHIAEQMFQSKDYAGTLQHAQKASDLVREAYLKESEYAQEQQQQQLERQRQQPLTRVAEVVVAVALVGGCAVAAVSYVRRRNRATHKHHAS